MTRAYENQFVRDLGPWFVFFFAIYVILLLKVITFHSLYSDAFFGIYSLLITTYILSRFLLAYLKKPVRADPSCEPTAVTLWSLPSIHF